MRSDFEVGLFLLAASVGEFLVIGVTSLFSFPGRIKSVDLAGEAGTLDAL